MSKENRASFFRQSGWMVIATFVGGIFMTLVHTVARKMDDSDYSAFVTLLRVLIILGIPSAALQTVFAQQAAAATNQDREAHLAATTRAIALWTFLIWVAVVIVTGLQFGPICRGLKIPNPMVIWWTLLLCLTSLWSPIVKGLLQGKHQFGGLGALPMLEGAGRFAVVAIFVLGFNGQAASAMSAALLASTVSLLTGVWLSRQVWTGHRDAIFNWRSWMRGAVPLTIGLGTVLLMSSIDMIFVQSLFTDTHQTALYGGAMFTGFAIIQFIAPVTTVMFPRIVRAMAHGQSSEGMKMTLAATFLFGCTAAMGCTLFPKLPLRLMYFGHPEMLAASPLVPWFAWALLPLTVANVLVQNVLARSRFDAVPWLFLVPVAYTAALFIQGPHLAAMPDFAAFTRVIQTLGVSCLVLCGVAAWFCQDCPPRALAGRDSATEPAIFDKSNSPAA